MTTRLRLTLLGFGTLLLSSGAALTFPVSGSANGPGGGPGRRPPSFEELDVDGDGSVTFEEFLAPMQTHLAERWAELDADGNDVLTADELAAAAPHGGGRGRRGAGDRRGLRGGQR